MNNLKSEIYRWFLLLLGGAIGTALAIVYLYLFDDNIQNAPADSFKESSYFLNMCVIFFLGLYNTGYFGAKLLKQSDLANEIHHNKKWHNILLNLLGLFFIICSSVWE